MEQGTTVPEILTNLKNRFCGCTHISGSVLINMEATPPVGRELNATDFNFLYHTEQVSGSINLRGIPTTSRIIWPKLRLIRGEELLGYRYALAVLNSSLGEFILPALTQVTTGSVLFSNSGELCNHNTVNWTDILDDGNVSRINTCLNPGQSSKTSSVSMCSSLRCCSNCLNGSHLLCFMCLHSSRLVLFYVKDLLLIECRCKLKDNNNY